jgi:hypothetical protein
MAGTQSKPQMTREQAAAQAAAQAAGQALGGAPQSAQSRPQTAAPSQGVQSLPQTAAPSEGVQSRPQTAAPAVQAQAALAQMGTTGVQGVQSRPQTAAPAVQAQAALAQMGATGAQGDPSNSGNIDTAAAGQAQQNQAAQQLPREVEQALTPNTGAQPGETSEKKARRAKRSDITKLPTIASSLAAGYPDMQTQGEPQTYPEEIQAGRAVKEVSPITAKLKQLGKEPAKERAKVGMYYGANALKDKGPHAQVIGAALGAMGGRAAGMLQSGEMEDQKRADASVEVLKTVGAAGMDNSIQFSDGGRFTLNTDKETQYQNVSSLSGKPTRTIYEVDKTNPLSNRGSAVAAPLAAFIVRGLMKHDDPQNPSDERAVNNMSAMMTNALLDNVQSMDQVNMRAREMVDKFGVTENGLRAFFDQRKSTISKEQAEQIRYGLKSIFSVESPKKTRKK